MLVIKFRTKNCLNVFFSACILCIGGVVIRLKQLNKLLLSCISKSKEANETYILTLSFQMKCDHISHTLSREQDIFITVLLEGNKFSATNVLKNIYLYIIWSQ